MADEGQQLARWVVQQIAQGRDHTEIAHDIERMGASAEAARKYVKDAARAVKKIRKRQQSKQAVVSLLGIVLVFALINGALWVVQELWAGDASEKVEQLEPQVEAARARVEALDRQLQVYAAESDRIDRLATELRTRSVFATAAAWRKAADRHDSLVAAWNEQLPDVQALQARRAAAVDEYNALADQYNSAARKTSKFYLIPIPGRSSK